MCAQNFFVSDVHVIQTCSLLHPRLQSRHLAHACSHPFHECSFSHHPSDLLARPLKSSHHSNCYCSMHPPTQHKAASARVHAAAPAALPDAVWLCRCAFYRPHMPMTCILVPMLCVLSPPRPHPCICAHRQGCCTAARTIPANARPGARLRVVCVWLLLLLMVMLMGEMVVMMMEQGRRRSRRGLLCGVAGAAAAGVCSCWACW